MGVLGTVTTVKYVLIASAFPPKAPDRNRVLSEVWYTFVYWGDSDTFAKTWILIQTGIHPIHIAITLHRNGHLFKPRLHTDQPGPIRQVRLHASPKYYNIQLSITVTRVIRALKIYFGAKRR